MMTEFTQPLISLVYASSAAYLFSDDELVDLLEDSVRCNKQAGISGLLLYKDSNFMQVIEGPEEAVMELYGRIHQDPRHKDILLLLKQTIPARQFADWRMGFVNIDRFSEAELPGFSAFLTDSFLAETYRKNPQRAYMLLLSFRDTLC